MIDPIPEWLRQTPNLESLHNLPNVPWGGYDGQGVPLPSLPELADFVKLFLEKVLERVVMAVVGFFIPGVGSFEQLQEWAQNLGAQITSFIYTNAGINLASWDDFVASLADGKGIDLPLLKAGLDFLSALFDGLNFDDLPTPAEAWTLVATVFLAPLNLFAIPADVQASINGALGDLQDALEGSYAGSGPIFLAVQALAEAWLTGSSALNAANLFGRLGLGQFGGGVPLNALTPSVANELEPFTALSVPSEDGWSYSATEDAAQLICDGSPKALYLKSGVIKVEEGQPLDTSIDVKYSGVTSGAGQTIRFVLETFTTDDGSGTATPVIVGAVTNPTGTITTPVTLGDSSWDIPPGVKSVRPVLEADELITAGTVYWLNTPELFKKLAGPLSGGLPAAIQDRIDDMQATWDKFKGGVGGTVDDIEDALDGAGQAIRDAIANALGHAGSGHTSANILTYLQNIPQTVVSGLGDLNTLTNQIRDILAGLVVTPINSTVAAIKDWFTGVLGKTQNLTSGGTLPPTAVGGVGSASNIGEAIEGTWSEFWGALTGNTGSNIPLPESSAELAQLVSTATSHSTAIAQLQADSEGTVFAGIMGSDDFERTSASNLGGAGYWAETYFSGDSTDGYMAIWNGHEAEWIVGDAVNRDGIFRCTIPGLEETATNYQKVRLVIGTRTAGVTGSPSLKLICRMNAGGTQYVFVKLTSGSTKTAQFGYRNGGAEILVGSPIACKEAVGQLYILEAGTPDDERIFRLIRNGSPILEWDDSSTLLSAIGASNRHWGWGAGGSVVAGDQFAPARVASVNISDNSPSAVSGVGLQVSRASVTAVTGVSGSDQIAPASFFDTTEVVSGITWDAATSTATVIESGWYTCSLSLTNSRSLAACICRGLLWVDGAVKRRGAADSESANTIGERTYFHSGSLFLPAGAQVQPGYYQNTSFDPFLLGDSNGTKSWFSMARVG